MLAPRFLGLSVVVAVSLASLGAVTGGCGQDVATCDSVCSLPHAPAASSCATQCSAEQASLSTRGYAGDFQSYLTCLANAGDYSAVSGECTSESATVAREYDVLLGGNPGPTGGSDAGSPIDAADATDAPSVILSGPCELGASCATIGGTCTIPGAGPCSSDERLICDVTLQLVADGFPCSAPDSVGCGFGSAEPDACSEECGCVNGLEVCTGDCPDGGPASP